MASRELITQAEYARRRGSTPAAVCKAVKRCGIPLVDGKLDPLVADTLWKARTDPDQQRRALGQNLRQPRVLDAGGADAPTPESRDWRARREAAEARLAELELQERERALVKRDEEERSARRLASTLVTMLSPIPDRISAEFAVDDTMRRRLRQRLADELDQVRAELSRAGLLAVQ